MNAIYKLIFNVSTGTWAVASELTASRGKKSRKRLAAAMAVALVAPAGAALATDTPTMKQCEVNEVLSADGLRCVAEHVAPMMFAKTSGVGISAIPADYIAHGTGPAVGSVATATGGSALALGANTRATGGYSIAIGAATSSDANGGRGAFAGGGSSVSIGVISEARANNSVALGASTLADRDNTVSVGAVNNRDGRSFTRQIVNVGKGTQANDAVVVSQLQSALDSIGGGSTIDDVTGDVSAPSFTVGGTTVNSIAAALTNVDGRVTSNEGDITQLKNDISSGAFSLVKQDSISNELSVAAATGGTLVDFTGTDGARTLAGVADGTLDATSNEAVNGSQLFATNENVARNTADIVTIADQLDGLADGTVGLVTYDDAAGVVSVAAGKAGDTVSFAGAGSARTLTGVAEGTVADDSEEAVNGSQLHATNERVATTETDIANLDGRMTSSEGNVANLTTQVANLSNGSVGLVQVDATTGDVKVAADKGGDVVDFEGTDGKRRLTGVANGIDDADTVTMAQLRAAGAIDPVTGDVLSVLTYDDSSLSRVSLGGSNGTVLANVANGFIGAGSREAVNGGQLHDLKQSLEGRIGDLDSRVGTIEQGIDDGSIGGGGSGNVGAPGAGERSVAIGDGSSADGAGSVAIGEQSNASGDGAVAMGEGASASGKDSVAVGKGSTADRDNEFSVGSEGNERVVSNVAAGTRPTDAVNLQQMDDRFQAERSYTDGRFTAMDKRIDRMGAMSSAMLNMATSAAGVQTVNRVGVGVGFQGGESAMSVGYQRALSDRATLTVSGAFSGDDKSAGFGAGFGW